jgi:hypothetical protein
MRKPIPNEKRAEEPREISWAYYKREKTKKAD